MCKSGTRVGPRPLAVQELVRDPWPYKSWSETPGRTRVGQRPLAVQELVRDPWPYKSWSETPGRTRVGPRPLAVQELVRDPWPYKSWSETPGRINLQHGDHEHHPSMGVSLLTTCTVQEKGFYRADHHLQ